MSRLKYTLIGEGEEGISASDWTEPVSEFPSLLQFYDDYESGELEFPIVELSSYLSLNGIIRKPLTDTSRDSLPALLEEVFGDNISVEWKHYSRDMPGASGSYCKVFARTSKLKEIYLGLKLIDTFLNSKNTQIGQNSDLDAFEVEDTQRSAEKPLPKPITEDTILPNRPTEIQKWEDELFNEVCRSVEGETTEVYARLHFLVFRARIFFLHKDGWWHSLIGDPRKVALRLEAIGHRITRVAVKRSSRGWIPYFARKSAEERGLGWFDPSLELESFPLEDISLINEARRALLAQEKAHSPDIK